MDIEIRLTNKGRGVYAKRTFEKGDIVETCPVIPMGTDAEWIEDTILDPFVYNGNTGRFLALGYGSLYNHWRNPNAKFNILEAAGVLVIRALKKIRKGEEILIRYVPEGWDIKILPGGGWRTVKVRGKEAKKARKRYQKRYE